MEPYMKIYLKKIKPRVVNLFQKQKLKIDIKIFYLVVNKKLSRK